MWLGISCRELESISGFVQAPPGDISLVPGGRFLSAPETRKSD